MKATSLMPSGVTPPPTLRTTIASLRPRPRKCAGSTRGSRQVIRKRRRLGKTTAPSCLPAAAKARFRSSAESRLVTGGVSCWLRIAFCSCCLGGSAMRRGCGGGAECSRLWRVIAAGRRVGGQQRERHHGARGGDTSGEVVGGAEAIEERRVGGVVDGRREHRMAGVVQLACDGERSSDGCVRGPIDGGRQPNGERAREPAGVQRGVHTADHSDAEGAPQE